MSRGQRRGATPKTFLPEPDRVLGIPADLVPVVVGGIVAITTIARLVYIFAVADYAAMEAPASGPDSPIYSAAAFELYQHGLTASDAAGIPFWPAGYPMFIALTYRLLGPGVEGAVFAQTLLVAVGLVSTYRLVARELTPAAGIVTVALLAMAPAFGFSATVFMYEPLLAVAAVVSADLVSQGVRARTTNQRALLLAGGLAVAGLGSMLQPKLLAVGVGLAAWAVWRTRRWVVPLLCALLLAIGPGGLIARNALAGQAPVMSANLGFTMLMGANDHARGGYVDYTLVAQACGDREPSFEPAMDRQWRECALDWMREHPGRTGALAVSKAAHFWLPFTGVLGERATWRQPLDHHRWLPESVTSHQVFRVIDIGLGAAWALGLVGLIVAGVVRLARDPARRAAAVLLAGPVVLFMLTTMATVGDARFRLPVAPFYTALIAVAVLPWVEARLGPREPRAARSRRSR